MVELGCIHCAHLIRDWEKSGGGSCPTRKKGVGYDGICEKFEFKRGADGV